MLWHIPGPRVWRWRALLIAALLQLFASLSMAQSPPTEQAVTWNAEDPRLSWGGCPGFLPAGCGIAVLHGDPAKDNVDVFLRVPGGSHLPMHWHTSAERMILVAGEMHVTYEGQATVVLRQGSYAYGPPKRPHEAACVSEGSCVLFIAFESPLDAVPVEGLNDRDRGR